MKILKLIAINFLVLILLFVMLEGGMRAYYAVSGALPPYGDLSMMREWRWVKARMKDGKVNFDQRFEYDAYTGWRNAANINTVVEHQGSIRTNGQGMRNDGDFPVESENHKPRLMIVGDSYSFGYGVSNEETYAYQLAGMIPGWEVMNMAVSATGTDQNYLTYEHHGARFKPDIVILGFYVLDYNRNTYSFRDYAKPLYLPQPDGSLRLTNVPVTPPRELIEQYRSGKKKIGGWHYSYAMAWMKQVLTDRIKRDRSEGSLGRRTLSGIMDLFAKRVRANGGKPVWVNFPIRDILSKEESKYSDISDFALAEASRLGMPALDLEPAYREYLLGHPEIKTLWRPENIGGHLSAEGNKVTAMALHDFLDKQGLLKQDLPSSATH